MSLPILDISEFQPNVTYSLTAKAVAGVILRVGYPGYGTAHGVYEDASFKTHFKGFGKQKTPIGAYWYACAVDDAGVRREVEMLCNILDEVGGPAVFKLPVYYDIEDTHASYGSLSCARRTDLALAWCDAVKKRGYTPGIYTYLNYVETGRLDMNRFANIPIWMAQYNEVCQYRGRYDLWQYTSTGTIPGIRGDVDLSSVHEIVVDNNTANKPSSSVKPVTKETPVQRAQKFLGVDADGIWGPITNDKAIRMLQKAIKVDVDGIVGPRTKAAFPLVLRGSTGQLVRIVQACLCRWFDIEIDGQFGDITLDAVKKFQQLHKLSVDGIVGKITITELLKLS